MNEWIDEWIMNKWIMNEWMNEIIINELRYDDEWINE